MFNMQFKRTKVKRKYKKAVFFDTEGKLILIAIISSLIVAIVIIVINIISIVNMITGKRLLLEDDVTILNSC